MITYIDGSLPNCQSYIDRLDAIVKTPADQQAEDPSAVFGEAYKADCAKRK